MISWPGRTLTERATTAERIYELLRDRIIRLKMKPGEALKEKELIAEFHVSRTPVREAILYLAAERLVTIYPQKGTFIAPIRIKDVANALFIRCAVEEAAVRAASEKDTSQTVEILEGYLSLAEEAAATPNGADSFYKLDEHFHQAILAATGRNDVWRTVNTVKAHMDRVRQLALPDPGHFPHVIKGHRAIVKALKDGDGEQAALAMRAHLTPLCEITEDLATRHPDFFDTSAHPND